MNILIIGNGFDLSHYLPTKYDHFMVAMQAVEKWDESKTDMGFDDLFGSLYEKENYFFSHTKSIYKTDGIQIPVKQIQELKEKLKDNVWYQYFLGHVKEIATWIDFEQKIEEALNLVASFNQQVNKKYADSSEFDFPIYLLTPLSPPLGHPKRYYLSELDILKLCSLNLCEASQVIQNLTKTPLYKLSKEWNVVENNPKYGFSIQKYLFFLYNKLEAFIEIFALYLKLIINQLLSTKTLTNFIKEWMYPDKIYSFNYTSTYLRLYKEDQNIDFLHGRSDKEQNIVLGISDLEHDSLRQLKAYGFTKYHQKLFKDTQYLFLSDDIDRIKKKLAQKNELQKSIENIDSQNTYSAANVKSKRKELASLTIDEEINIYIWGHSLDRSDANYIKEIFSFNGEVIDHPCHVTVFFFNHQAKFDLLSNLLDILGNELVETWMKKGWLKFEPNPNIVKINNINPVKLPKLKKQT